MLPRKVQAVLLASLLPALAACVAAPAPGESAPVVASVIVKPRVPSTAEAVVDAARRRLGDAAGVRYARPLSGDAHLLYLTVPATAEQVPALVERLRGVDAFQYVERDSTMKIQ